MFIEFAEDAVNVLSSWSGTCETLADSCKYGRVSNFIISATLAPTMDLPTNSRWYVQIIGWSDTFAMILAFPFATTEGTSPYRKVKMNGTWSGWIPM